jgi:hypothetical protein
MVEYEYEVRFDYERVYIGTLVFVDELDHAKAFDAAVKKIWEMNGIDIDVADCVNVSFKNTGMIGG